MNRTWIAISLLSLLLLTGAHAANNALKNHNSPYLALHGHDPVNWQEWNEHTVLKARQQNKLLFVSSGYFSCHWCHVMQRESYSNRDIARLLNQYFIPVKVDRELNPSLDSRLIDFVEKTRGYAGWPLNVFVTPEGYPLVGMVYLPTDDFQQLLQKLQSEWHSRDKELKNIARNASLELNGYSNVSVENIDHGFAKQIKSSFIRQAFEMADEIQGGFGDQNKFPSVPQLEVLLRQNQVNKDKKLSSFLQLTLDSMASQGLRDQLGGGFFRYSVDPGWQVPHFEKMLYDNALLARLYLRAARVFKRKDYEQVSRETLDFMLDNMVDDGAFIASFSAIDNNNVEGGHYLWTEDELATILTPREKSLVSIIWQIDSIPDIEHGEHLVTAESIGSAAKQLKLDITQARKIFNSARNKMLKVRSRRVLPRDNKKIASWNGLVLSALVEGARLDSDAQKYRQAAAKLVGYINKNFWNGKQLYRAVNNTVFGKAGLEDGAYLAEGLLSWAMLTGKKADFENVRTLIKVCWKRFYTPQGWQLNEKPLLKYAAYSIALPDGPMASPSATMIRVSKQFMRVHNLASDKIDLAAVEAGISSALNQSSSPVKEQPFWHASYTGLY